MTTERPILFNATMVRAILSGAKTVTRRPVAPMAGRQRQWLTPALLTQSPRLTMCRLSEADGGDLGAQMEHPKGGPLGWVRCPFGAPGDRLWVRETWALAHLSVDCEGVCDDVEEFTGRLIAANRDGYWAPIYAADADDINNHPSDRLVKRYRPSIHMPRWASRLMLEVVSVRVERLQDITEADAEAEGLARNEDFDRGPYANAREEFAQLWNSINGKRAPWVSNPWVWVITFKPLQEVPHDAPTPRRPR